MNAFRDIVVCLPTVPSRAAVLAETLAQWARFGVTPLVETQPAEWPLSGPSQRRNAERALRRALDARPAATHVLFTEDDVDLAPDLPNWLPALCWLDAPVTLFVPLLRHYPPALRRQVQRGEPLTEGVFPVAHQAEWWGTQAVVLPRELVEAVLCWESGRNGWDAHLSAYLKAHQLPLAVTVPNLVQQRAVRTLMTESEDGGQHRSQTFGQPHTGSAISPPAPAPALERAPAPAGR
jgi:hypothetical protein